MSRPQHGTDLPKRARPRPLAVWKCHAAGTARTNSPEHPCLRLERIRTQLDAQVELAIQAEKPLTCWPKGSCGNIVWTTSRLLNFFAAALVPGIPACDGGRMTESQAQIDVAARHREISPSAVAFFPVPWTSHRLPIQPQLSPQRKSQPEIRANTDRPQVGGLRPRRLGSAIVRRGRSRPWSPRPSRPSSRTGSG